MIVGIDFYELVLFAFFVTIVGFSCFFFDINFYQLVIFAIFVTIVGFAWMITYDF